MQAPDVTERFATLDRKMGRDEYTFEHYRSALVDRLTVIESVSDFLCVSGDGRDLIAGAVRLARP